MTKKKKGAVASKKRIVIDGSAKPLVSSEPRTWAELDRILQEKFGKSLTDRVAALGGPNGGR